MPPAGCSYRITLCTATALPPSSRVLVAARGPDGYTLPVAPLAVPSSGLAPDVVHTSVVHTVADPGSLLTHLELYTEPTSGAERPSGPPRRLLGRAGQPADGDGDGAAWRVRWVAVEELAPGAGGRGEAKMSDEDSGSEEGDETSAAGGDDASRPAMRVFFFPVDKARVPRGPAGSVERQASRDTQGCTCGPSDARALTPPPRGCARASSHTAGASCHRQRQGQGHGDGDRARRVTLRLPAAEAAPAGTRGTDVCAHVVPHTAGKLKSGGDPVTVRPVHATCPCSETF